MKNPVKKAPRILVVEDHPSTRMLIYSLLQGLGYDDTHLVENGAKALTELNRRRYDLILSDWTMPEMDGLTLWGRIREDERLKKVPFILITATNEIEMVKKAISEGITDYIVKPITLKALTEKVARALNQAG